MVLEGVSKRTEHRCYSIGIYLQEQRMVTRTEDGKLVCITSGDEVSFWIYTDFVLLRRPVLWRVVGSISRHNILLDRNTWDSEQINSLSLSHRFSLTLSLSLSLSIYIYIYII